MDQVKIGSFLKKLRNEQGFTQEQLAEQFGVTGRTVSRWENGNNMPDISILVELAEFYDVDIKEIINGERKSEEMNNETKEAVNMVAEYSGEEKKSIIKKIQQASIAALIALVIEFALTIYNRLDLTFYFWAVAFGCIFAVSVYSSSKYAELIRNKKYVLKIIGILLGVLAGCMTAVIILSVI